MILKPTTIYVSLNGDVLEQTRTSIYRYSDINEIRLVSPLAVQGSMRINFLLSNGVTIEQKLMGPLAEKETVNGEEWNVWSYRPTNVITATLTAQSVSTLQLSFTQVTTVEGKQFGNTFGTVTLSVKPVIQGPEPQLADANEFQNIASQISGLATNLNNKVDKNISGYTTLQVIDEDETFVYVYYNGGSYKVTLQDWINLVNTQFTGLVTRVETLESRVNQDVRNSASPTFVQITLGAQTITATKVADYDAHIISTANPHQVTKAQVGLGSVTDDKQIKAAASSTNNRVPKWSGTTGDAIVDGFDVKTTITDSDTDLPTGKAVKTALDLKLDANKINFITSGDEIGKIDASSLPSYVDDVIGVDTFGDLPATGEFGKIYYVRATNITYRWTGSEYVNLIGTAAQTAVDTSAFNDKLETTDNTVQKALDRLDDHTHTYEEITEKPEIYTEAEVNALLADKANVADLSSSIILYPTTAASDVSTYNKLVDSINNADYDTTAVNIPTGVVANAAFPDPELNNGIARFVADAGLFIGNPGVINVTVTGNIRKTAGGTTQGAEFRFAIFKRNAQGTEEILATSSPTTGVTATSFEQFTASGILNNGEFTATDRIVYKFYGKNVGGGSPEFEFQFGGTEPVRALLPLPVNVTLQADKVFFDSSGVDLTSTNVQDALVELDGLLEEGLTVITVPDYTIVAADDGSGGFTYSLGGTNVTGTKDGSKFVFTLPTGVEYETGVNRLSVKVDGSDGTLKRLFYGADSELTEPSDTTFAVDYALVDNDKVYAKVFQSLATVTLNIADASVTESKIADGAVTTNKVANNAVDFTKIQQIPTDRILGNDTGADGNVKALTANEAKTLLALDQVDNTADTAKPVSQAQQIEFDKVNNATEIAVPSNPQNSDFLLDLTNALTPNAILTVKFPDTVADDTQQARIKLNANVNYYLIQDSTGTDLLGSSVTGKTLRLVVDSGNTRARVLETDEVAYTAFGWGDHAQAGYLTEETITEVQAEGTPLTITNKTVNVTRASLGAGTGDANTETYTATIDTSWSGTAPATQTVTVTGITSTDNPIIDIVMSGTFATDKTRNEEFGKIYRAVTNTDSITFSADGVPSVSLPIQVKVIR